MPEAGQGSVGGTALRRRLWFSLLVYRAVAVPPLKPLLVSNAVASLCPRPGKAAKPQSQA